MVGDVFPKTIALVVDNGPRRQVALFITSCREWLE